MTQNDKAIMGKRNMDKGIEEVEDRQKQEKIIRKWKK